MESSLGARWRLLWLIVGCGLAGRAACGRLGAAVRAQTAKHDRRGDDLRGIAQRCVAGRESLRSVERAFVDETESPRIVRGKGWTVVEFRDAKATHIDSFPPEDLRWRLKIVLDSSGRAARFKMDEKDTTL